MLLPNGVSLSKCSAKTRVALGMQIIKNMPESATSARLCSVDGKDLSSIEICMMNKFAT